MTSPLEKPASLADLSRSPLLRYLGSKFLVRDLLLIVLTLAALAGVCANDLVNLDDNKYVQNNLNVENGLDPEGVVWAFQTFQASNWHPLTWLSLQLDVELFHVSPVAFHRTNLVLHVANVLLLAEVLRRMTGRLWASAAVAALFAVHPLHVESVAWVSERKDVLSTFFGLLALAAYVRYAHRPGIGQLALVALAYVASLLAKPMLVTLPCLLLLLDYWPLRRLDWGQSPDGTVEMSFARNRLVWLVAEKVPLFLLAAGSCVMTVLAQSSGGALKSLDRFPLGLRLANALVATASYLGQTFWPVDLAVYYPYPRAGLPWQLVLPAGLLLVLITAWVCWLARSRPYLLVGWFWFLGTLVPVIGLVQVGQQAHADRYTYIPLIGLFLMVVWALHELLPARRGAVVLVPLTVAVLAACAYLTRVQVKYWANSITLWEHTLAVTRANPFAEIKYGEALQKEGRTAEAVEHLKEAIRLDSRMYPAYSMLGDIYRGQQQWDDAEECYRKAADLQPDVRHYRAKLEELRRERQLKDKP